MRDEYCGRGTGQHRESTLGMLSSGVCRPGMITRKVMLGLNKSFGAVKGKDIPGKVTES